MGCLLQHYETVRQESFGTNGHASPFPIPTFEPSVGLPPPPIRPASPHIVGLPPPPIHVEPPHMDDSFTVAREEQSRVEERHETRATPSPCPEPRQPSPVPVVNVNVHTPPPSPFDRSFVSSANVSRRDVKSQNNDLATKLVGAQNEIQRLRALLAAAPDPAEIRRRTRALSSEETLPSERDIVSDVGTSSQEQHTCSCQEGALPQQVGIVALLVFTMTYLFF
jgi:vesicle-associated membrane protein-associated protein A